MTVSTSFSTSLAIETRGLRKVFGEKVAVGDLTLTVERGEVFGFLGPNGAGKTTSIKMLLSLVCPTSGEGYLFGQPLGDPAGAQPGRLSARAFPLPRLADRRGVPGPACRPVPASRARRPASASLSCWTWSA